MPTRTRSTGTWSSSVKGEYGHTTVQPYNYGTGGSPSVTQTSTWDSQTDTRESMTDVIGSYGQVNPCTHTKREFDGSFRNASMVTKDSRVGQTGRREHYWKLGGGYYLQTFGSTLLSVPDGKAVAISRVPTLAQEQVSVLNSLYELKDMKGSLNRIRNHLMWARFRARKYGTGMSDEILDGLFPGFAGFKNLKPSEVLRSFVGLDLAWKFGWKPFLEDIRDVCQTLARLDDKLAQIASGWYPCVGRHRETKSQTDQLFTAQPFGDKCRASAYVKREITTTVTAGVMRRLSDHAMYRPDMTQLYLMREQLGLSLNASRVWQAIPFSFVADFIIPIQDFLDQFSGAIVPSEYVVDGSKWITRKSVQRTEVTMQLAPYLEFPYAVMEPLSPRTLTWTGRYQTYNRSTTESWQTPPLYIPELRLPDLGQWWTGAELLIARFRTIAR